MFYKNVVLKNLTKFTGKHLCQSLFLNKFAFAGGGGGGEGCKVVKKVTLTQVLSCKFCGIFKNFPVSVFGATKLLLTIFVGDDIDVKMERSSFY